MGIFDYLGAGGQFLSGVGSFLNSTGIMSKGPDIASMDNAYRAQARGMAQGAKIMGVHPLAMLGVNPASPTPGGWQGVNLEKMGQGIDRAMMALADLSPEGKLMRKLKVEEQKGKNRLQNALALKAERDADGQTGPRGRNLNNAIIEENLPVEGYGNYQIPTKNVQAVGGGYEYGEEGGYKGYFDPDGLLIPGAAEGLQDMVSEDLMAKLRFYGPQIGRWARTAWHNLFDNTKKANAHRNKVRAYLDALTKALPPPKGFYYAYDLGYGTARRIPVAKYRRQQLFDTRGTVHQKYSRYGKD